MGRLLTLLLRKLLLRRLLLQALPPKPLLLLLNLLPLSLHLQKTPSIMIMS
jgi:hypothetical protein